MHDCQIAQERLIDLLFDELEPAASAQLLAEVDGCPRCGAEYQTMSQSLRAFDRAAEHVAPPERYWLGYETRLRARLAEATTAGWPQRLSGWLSGIAAFPAPATVAATAMLLLALLLGAWWWMRLPQPGNKDSIAVDSGRKRTPPSAVPTQPEYVQHQTGASAHTTTSAPRPRQRKTPAQRSVPIELPAKPPVTPTDELAQFQPPPAAAPFLTPDTTRHFEQAQLLLRSFRNAGRNAEADVEYEKRRSRSLLYQNILLRREAEAKGNLPAREVLGALEPLLLDIANLPAKTSRRELQSINERIARQEMIAVLHAHATPPASFDPGQD
jgi:hypothetical protein